MSGSRVIPLKDLAGELLSVERPSRYLGGEYGSIRKEGEGLFTMALCFPDLYEIGMSNNAIRLLYGMFNTVPGLRCERVFAPAPDFESLLARQGLPLYTLESGIALCDTDMLGVSLGYELALSGFLSVLSAGGIPILAAQRGRGDPIVVAGGPAVGNPHPYADFIDAAFIGEAEADFTALLADLAAMKKAGSGRGDFLERMAREPAIWMPARGGRPAKKAMRAIFAGFSASPSQLGLPTPTSKPVQDHGTVEIMRGCPNGCRFCHAGFFYRPQRIKSYPVIKAEVETLVRSGGYREITLSSLSSGDYPGLEGLLSALNAEWSARHVSFQLPSLKVNSLTLPVIAQLSRVRKSGLTFAVETPRDEWQRSINKNVSFEKIISILREARSQGFRQAKFYFMIGLPLPGRGEGEALAILDYIERLCAAQPGMQFGINVGVFVPKAHTPYERAAQLGEEEALAAMRMLRQGLRQYRNIKLSYHEPFVSLLEGLVSRGDERVGALALEAFKRGARLDAWEEHFNKELWRSLIDECGWNPLAEFGRERGHDEPLPWNDVSIRVSGTYRAQEMARSEAGLLTPPCMENCESPCGSCSTEVGLVEKTIQAAARESNPRSNTPAIMMLFSFTRHGVSALMQHLSVIDALSRALLMSDFPVIFSEGFNPMPRLETVQPLPIGVESEAEISLVSLAESVEPGLFVDALNRFLPDGLRLSRAMQLPLVEGRRRPSIGSASWGSVFRIRPPQTLGLAAFSEGLLGLIAQRAIPDASLERISDALLLRLPDPKRKEHNLLRLLESLHEGRPIQSHFRVDRLECLAGTESPKTFFEYFESQAR